MNPTMTIDILDFPRRLRAGFSTLQSSGSDEHIKSGNVISEVGPAVSMRHPAYPTPFMAYHLRKQHRKRLPSHFFGKCRLGDAFSAFLPRVVPLPVVGSHITIDPYITPEQSTIMKLYQYVRADFFWIIHIPSPIGTGVIVEIYCPEIDKTTKTRSVRFKPAAVNTIAFYAPWSNDLSFVPITEGRKGQSGGSINIRVVEDNTTETVNTPLNVTVYQCTANVFLASQRPDSTEFTTIPGLNFQPVSTTAMISDKLWEHGDDESTVEVQAEGVNAGAVIPKLDESPTTELTTKPEEQAPDPKLDKKDRKNKKQTGAVNTKWFEIDTIELSPANLLKWKEVTIDPTKFQAKGENPGMPYRRNLWVTGSSKAGYVRTSRIKVAISRPPAVGGTVEFCDSNNNSSRYNCDIGGNTEMDTIPSRFSGADPIKRARYINNKYLRTNEAMTVIRYRVTSYNRTADVANVNCKLLFKIGDTAFDTPIKPKKKTNILRWLSQQYDNLTRMRHNHPSITQHGWNEEDTVIAPYAGEHSYEGEIDDDVGIEELLDQDEFAIKMWDGDLTNDQIVTVPMNIAVAKDLNSEGPSPISEKFERYAHIVPTEDGNLGPCLARYVIETRLPTTISGNINHVSLPGDLNDEAMSYAFGLGNILNIATSALSIAGGPSVAAGIAAGRGLFGMVKGIGGKLFGNNSTAAENQPTIGGPIEVSRFIDFLKVIADNEKTEPTFGSLLMQATNLIGGDGKKLESIPARVWAIMKDAKVERGIYDRTIIPTETLDNDIYVPYDRWSNIIDNFGACPETFIRGTHQHECFIKFISVTQSDANCNAEAVSLQQILNYKTTAEDRQRIESLLESNLVILQSREGHTED